MKKLLLLLFSLMISLSSYSETYVCSHILSWTLNTDFPPTIQTNKFIRDGDIFQRHNVEHIYEIYYEDDKYLILDANFGLLGRTIIMYIDKESRDYVYSVSGLGGGGNSNEQGECEVVY